MRPTYLKFVGARAADMAAEGSLQSAERRRALDGVRGQTLFDSLVPVGVCCVYYARVLRILRADVWQEGAAVPPVLKRMAMARQTTARAPPRACVPKSISYEGITRASLAARLRLR